MNEDWILINSAVIPVSDAFYLKDRAFLMRIPHPYLLVYVGVKDVEVNGK